MPSDAEARFISSAKASTEPDTPSAMATAISFADFTISMTSALCNVTSEPALNPILEGAARQARGDIITGVSSVRRP